MSNDVKILNITKKKKKFMIETSQKNTLLHEDTILHFYIFKDKVFNDDEWKSVIDYEDIVSLFEKTLKYLSFQARSTSEIRSFLKAKSLNETHQEQVLLKIQDLGYLNDEKYAYEMLDYEMRHQKGPLVVIQKLKQKHLSEELIQQILMKYDEEQERKIIDELVEKLSQKNQEESLLKQKDIIIQKLLRDGFKQSLILESLSRVAFVDESLTKLPSEIEKLQRRYIDLPKKESDQKILRHLLAKGFSFSQINDLLKQAPRG
ncbi:MAG: RecX family transcriptional regulator [Bacilli bacterium]